MKISTIREMNTRVEDGAWVPSALIPGVQFKVRGTGSTEYDRRLLELWNQVPADKRADDGEAERVNTEAILDILLLDWKGIDEKFTREAAAEALRIPLFRRAVLACAQTVGRDGKASLEADVKN